MSNPIPTSVTFFSAVMAIALAACGGSSKPAGGAAAPTGGAAAIPDQQARGAQIYADACAKCHGAKGEGHGDKPPVMGTGALPLDPPKDADDRKGKQFRTAQDVFAFTKEFMPDHAGGSLTDAQYWDVTAFMLMGRGVALDGKTLDATTGAAITVNR